MLNILNSLKSYQLEFYKRCFAVASHLPYQSREGAGSPDFMSQEHTGSDNPRCGSCGGGRTGVGVAVPPVTLRDDNCAWATSPGCTTPANFGLTTLHFFCICMRGVMKFLYVVKRQIE